MGRVNILARSWYLRLGGASVILSVVALLPKQVEHFPAPESGALFGSR
jgi:hypothetical protein